MNPIINELDKASMRQDVPAFRPGDSVRVHVKVVEGNKSRIQVFAGVVIARNGKGITEAFTVRKVSYGTGVERTFPLHSPKVVRIKTVRRGKIRRCKLYYLRERVGRARKLRERRISAEARKAALEAQLAKARALREADEVAQAAREREAAAKTGSPEMATSEA